MVSSSLRGGHKPARLPAGCLLGGLQERQLTWIRCLLRARCRVTRILVSSSPRSCGRGTAIRPPPRGRLRLVSSVSSDQGPGAGKRWGGRKRLPGVGGPSTVRSVFFSNPQSLLLREVVLIVQMMTLRPPEAHSRSASKLHVLSLNPGLPASSLKDLKRRIFFF